MKIKPNPEGQLLVGVDIGGTNIRAGLVDQDGHVLTEARRLTPQGDPDTAVEMICEAIEEAMQTGAASREQVRGIGMGIAGSLQSDRGIVVHSYNLGWIGVQVVEPVETRFGLATYILNDVNTATLGEHRFGAGRGHDHVVMITLGTGIGGGAVVDGKLRIGPTEGFAEVGHMTLDPDGPPCSCGNHGCWEALAGRDVIIDRAVRAIERGRASSLFEAVDYRLGSITPALIAQHADQGDQLALEVMEETGNWVGIGIATLIQLYNPEVVVVGGGIAQAGRVLWEPMLRTVRARARMVPWQTCQVVPSALGADAGLVGASVLVLERLDESKASRKAGS